MIQAFNLDTFMANLILIQQTSGKNDKRSLLLDLTASSPMAKSILSLALNPRTPMYIGEEANLSKIQLIESDNLLSEAEAESIPQLTLSSLMMKLHKEEIGRGHTSLAAIRVWLNENCATDDEKELILSLIQKNPRLGVSWHSFTKVTGTDKFEVMLAKDINKVKKMDEKVQFPVTVQSKLDVYRCIYKTNIFG